MTRNERPIAFWCICVFLALSLVLLLLGQTSAVFAYDFTVSIGLQESMDDVSEYGIEVNRAFGVADTIVYIPLIVMSLIGLVRRRPWALPVTAAVMGISAYWTVTIAFMFFFLPGVPGYNLVPGMEYWVALGSFFGIGVWGILYIALRGDRLVRGS